MKIVYIDRANEELDVALKAAGLSGTAVELIFQKILNWENKDVLHH